jgi:hypothetical protein
MSTLRGTTAHGIPKSELFDRVSSDGHPVKEGHESKGELRFPKYKLRIQTLQLLPGCRTSEWKLSAELADQWRIPRDPPSDVITWILANMLLISIPVLEILDQGMNAAPCLCCYWTESEYRATEVAIAVGTVRRYFSQESHTASNGFHQCLRAMLRDVTPREETMIKSRFPASPSAEDASGAVCKILNRIRGLCVIAPPCRKSTLWVYSSALGRKFLRYATRACRKDSVVARVSMLTEDTKAVPRFAYRMYVLSTGLDSQNQPRASISAQFWKSILVAGEALLAAPRRSTTPREIPPPVERKAVSRPIAASPPASIAPASANATRNAIPHQKTEPHVPSPGGFDHSGEASLPGPTPPAARRKGRPRGRRRRSKNGNQQGAQ